MWSNWIYDTVKAVYVYIAIDYFGKNRAEAISISALFEFERSQPIMYDIWFKTRYCYCA